MDILKVIANFQTMTQNAQAHVLVALLDFRMQHLDEFNRRYGTVTQDHLITLLKDVS